MSRPIDHVARQAGEWLRGVGPLHEIVISTRIRLARNIRGYHFLSRAEAAMREEIADTLHRAIRKATGLGDFVHVDVEKLDDLDRKILVERQLVSRQHAEGSGAPRGVRPDRNRVGERSMRDHRGAGDAQRACSRPGLEQSRHTMRIDERVEILFHTQYGYRTACRPTSAGHPNLGHAALPRRPDERIRKGRQAANYEVAIRGLYGEGTEALGDFFQISNQTHPGRSEEEIIHDVGRRDSQDRRAGGARTHREPAARSGRQDLSSNGIQTRG